MNKIELENEKSLYEHKIVHYNNEIQKMKIEQWIDINDLSDWYHTFWELYKHRIHLFIALCRHITYIMNKEPTWYEWLIKSKKHHDRAGYDWWFIVQLETGNWQISYHLPNEYWDECDFIETKEHANEWDWHTSDDVLERLLNI